RLADEPGHPDQVGPRVHQGQVQDPVRRVDALGEQPLVLISLFTFAQSRCSMFGSAPIDSQGASMRRLLLALLIAAGLFAVAVRPASAAGAFDYGEALQKSMFFYQAQIAG